MTDSRNSWNENTIISMIFSTFFFVHSIVMYMWKHERIHIQQSTAVQDTCPCDMCINQSSIYISIMYWFNAWRRAHRISVSAHDTHNAHRYIFYVFFFFLFFFCFDKYTTIWRADPSAYSLSSDIFFLSFYGFIPALDGIIYFMTRGNECQKIKRMKKYDLTRSPRQI